MELSGIGVHLRCDRSLLGSSVPFSACVMPGGGLTCGNQSQTELSRPAFLWAWHVRMSPTKTKRQIMELFVRIWAVHLLGCGNTRADGRLQPQLKLPRQVSLQQGWPWRLPPLWLPTQTGSTQTMSLRSCCSAVRIHCSGRLLPVCHPLPGWAAGLVKAADGDKYLEEQSKVQLFRVTVGQHVCWGCNSCVTGSKLQIQPRRFLPLTCPLVSRWQYLS